MITNGVLQAAGLVAVANAPGYRDIGIILDLNDGSGVKRRVEVRLSAAASAQLLAEIINSQRLAWRGGKPCDHVAGESEPFFLKAFK